jgi:hypothetical protein
MSSNAEAGLMAIEADREFFAKSGQLPTAWNDIRRFPRFYLRGEALAHVEPPYGDGKAETLAILTCDVSRSGVGIVSPRQLFPDQRLEIQMPAGPSYRLKTVWCRRIEAGRYAVGCAFVE